MVFVMQHTVLFLCTGNYYRSRFAEELFNFLAPNELPDWVASSRALAIELGIYNHGPMSVHTKQALAERGIPLPEPLRSPLQVSEAELASARLIIALKEVEHRPYLTKRYPAWRDRVTYWNIHDLDKATPNEALAAIADKVIALMNELKSTTDKK
jgi:protein-tyrosine phosphatase